MADLIVAGSDDPGRLNDVSRQDFLDWKHNPVTKVFRKFLADYIAQVRADHTDRWEKSDTIDIALEAEARGRVLAVSEIHALTFEEILGFYQQETTTNDAKIGGDFEG